jgi:hypothetical protein
LHTLGNFSGPADVYTDTEARMATTIDIRTLFPLSANVAWARYLEATRGIEGEEYERVEGAAWEELQVALSRLPERPTEAA